LLQEKIVYCLYFERAVEASCIDITTGYKWIRNKDVE